MKIGKRLQVKVRRFFQPRVAGFGGRRAERIWQRVTVRRAGLAGVTFVLISLLVTPSQFLRRPYVTEGSIAQNDIVAPYKFAVEKDRTALRREQEEAAARVLPVFRENPNIAGIAQDELAGFFVVVRQLADTYALKRGLERDAFLN